MSSVYAVALWAFLTQTLLSGSCEFSFDMNIQSLYCPLPWWLEPFYYGGNATFDTISSSIQNFATGATNKFRTIAKSNYNAGQHDLALGAVSQATVCIAFDWKWLLLPIILVVITAVLLALIVIQNYREPQQPVWKSSLLPFLFYGIRGESSSEDGIRPALGLTELDKQAKCVQGRWYAGINAGFVTSEKDIDLDSLLEPS
ncbi:hypothetical protein KVR01_008343 [Diaporthe batatas]|uniref:uncharacterized protein n=1 Tax=Diaporthe batatas TaxID=748121 RepID=UPI001D051677|nr:uncharacterized protein KVR01_008343 [Diaporthe batatas]KAG8162578.1 hypothetical protein KVR01_008343 [Diaporthe batatas]